MRFLPFDEIVCSRPDGKMESIFSHAERQPHRWKVNQLQENFSDLRYYDSGGAFLSFDAVRVVFYRNQCELKPMLIVRNGVEIDIWVDIIHGGACTIG